MKPNIMLDLETLGSRPGSIIIALGAVRFDGDAIQDTFYRNIDAHSAAAIGLTMDVATVFWWFKQSAEARLEATKAGKDIKEALADFADWIGPVSPCVWGNGASFDNALLAEAYLRAGRPRPWEFWDDRCYRTIKAQHPQVRAEHTGLKHHALDDATAQARHLMAIWRSHLEPI